MSSWDCVGEVGEKKRANTETGMAPASYGKSLENYWICLGQIG